jgi:hypothetical protein
MPLILDGTNGETFPSWTTAGRPSPAATGQVGYNTSLNVLETYNGTAWIAGGLPTPSTSGNVLTSDGTNWVSSAGAIGVGQTWQDVTSSRVAGTTYTNSTGKPIQVFINIGTSGGGSCTITVGAMSLGGTIAVLNNSNVLLSFIVPNSTTYVLTTSNSSISKWTELR